MTPVSTLQSPGKPDIVKKDFADLIKERALQWADYPGLSR